MADSRTIRETLERAVGEVLDARMGEMRRELISRVARELEPALAVAPGSAPIDLLNAAIHSVQDAVSQADILRAMLDGAAKFSKRCGLLVLRGSTATGWQARGFADNDIFRTVSIDGTRGLIARVLNSKLPAGAATDEFDSSFAIRFGSPANGNVSLLPLVIKDKVAALLYADGGDEGSDGLDSSALELLVRSTGLWVELLSLRKAAAPVEGLQPIAAPVHPVSAAPSRPAPPMPERPAVTTVPASVIPAPVISQPPPVIGPPTAVAAPPADANEDPVHTKARRFAKLLVDEIKLYNQTKVNEGRANSDLYDRLKDDIDKSRAAYDKRYGTAVGDVNYFRQELVRILADNDVSLLGQNFPR